MHALKTQEIRDDLSMHIDTLDIAGFLADEAKKFLEYIHYYKLRNVYRNLNTFLDYLQYLDSFHTKQLIQLLQSANIQQVFVQSSLEDEEITYFLSDKAKEEVSAAGLDTILCDAGFDRYCLLNIVMRIKGLFLLSASEFCHASAARIAAYNHMFHHKVG